MVNGFIPASPVSIDWRKLAIRRCRCPACDRQRWFVRIGEHETQVRCLGCRASPITLSLIAALNRFPEQLAGHVYELSARGALIRYLQGRAGRLTCSEYLAGVPVGESKDGIRCENVESLSFGDRQFSLVTSTEVFEHVADDLAGFREIRRVLQPGGLFLFTVPLADRNSTVTRARRASDGKIEHLLQQAFHTDPARDGQRVLVYRDYGVDITERLLAAGFAHAEILDPGLNLPWGAGRPVILAKT